MGTKLNLQFAALYTVAVGACVSRQDQSPPPPAQLGEAAQQITAAVDNDGDGFYTDADPNRLETSEDCNDNDASVYPGAQEYCGDNLDNDCNGGIDDRDFTCVDRMQDADGDGYFVANDFLSQAEEDCDDTRSDVHPGQEELACSDRLDNDCDGQMDFQDMDCSVPTDADGDGYFTDNDMDNHEPGEDCDDNNASVRPDGTETDCDDGLDNDCDWATDEAEDCTEIFNSEASTLEGSAEGTISEEVSSEDGNATVVNDLEGGTLASNEADEDSDDDGIPNVDDNDMDGDGVDNSADPDMDGDGILDSEETSTDATSTNRTTNHYWEIEGTRGSSIFTGTVSSTNTAYLDSQHYVAIQFSSGETFLASHSQAVLSGLPALDPATAKTLVQAVIDQYRNAKGVGFFDDSGNISISFSTLDGVKALMGNWGQYVTTDNVAGVVDILKSNYGKVSVQVIWSLPVYAGNFPLSPSVTHRSRIASGDFTFQQTSLTGTDFFETHGFFNQSADSSSVSCDLDSGAFAFQQVPPGDLLDLFAAAVDEQGNSDLASFDMDQLISELMQALLTDAVRDEILVQTDLVAQGALSDSEYKSSLNAIFSDRLGDISGSTAGLVKFVNVY